MVIESQIGSRVKLTQMTRRYLQKLIVWAIRLPSFQEKQKNMCSTVNQRKIRMLPSWNPNVASGHLVPRGRVAAVIRGTPELSVRRKRFPSRNACAASRGVELE